MEPEVVQQIVEQAKVEEKKKVVKAEEESLAEEPLVDRYAPIEKGHMTFM